MGGAYSLSLAKIEDDGSLDAQDIVYNSDSIGKCFFCAFESLL